MHLCEILVVSGHGLWTIVVVLKAFQFDSCNQWELCTFLFFFQTHYLLTSWVGWLHILIRGVLIQSCSAWAEKFTNYVFFHPQFSGVIQNIENVCAIIRAKFWKFDFWLYKIDYFDNNRHRQTGVKMAQWFSIFWITPLNCGWKNT